MKRLHNLLMLSALASLTLFMGCNNDDGGDDNPDPDPTGREAVVDALESGSWTIDEGASSVANLDIDESTIGVSFTASSFTLSGDITPYASGGSFTVEEDGSISGVSVTIASDELQVVSGTESMSINSSYDQVTITFDTEDAAARVGGIGGYELVFTSN